MACSLRISLPLLVLIALLATGLSACAVEQPSDPPAPESSEPPPADPTFETVVVSDSANLWWARAVADFNDDDILDVALIDNNGYGGRLLWLETSADLQTWTPHVIAETPPGGGTFAAGDLDAGDINGDRRPDVLGFAHPGEWNDGAAPTTVYWYEYLGGAWASHEIGEVPAFVKDVNLTDFDGDGRLDLAAITYEGNSLTIFRQDIPTRWNVVAQLTLKNLHEGMDTGDLDGDGDADIAANGYWVENPGGDLTAPWRVHTIDPRWHTQTGDWSRNATKVAVADVTGDGGPEVVISHSEREGYPLLIYTRHDTSWTSHEVASDWPAAQSLQVADFNLDGRPDILSGVNRTRAQDIGLSDFPVRIFLAGAHPDAWQEIPVAEDGIYNAQAADIDGDGDVDILRLPAHDATRLELLENQIR